MRQTLEAQIELKVHFIAGLHAQKRELDDPRIASAEQDSRKLLETLPTESQNPSVIAGKTSNPNIMLSLSWLVFSNGGKMSHVNIQCLGNGVYNADWNSQGNAISSREDIPLQEILALGLTEKINSIAKVKSSIDIEQQLSTNR